MATDNYAKDLTRRDFLIKSGKAALAVGGGLEFLTSCATPGSKEKPVATSQAQPESVIYPTLKGHKIQPPENGCFFGIRTVYDTVKVHEPNIPRDVISFIEFYEKQLGKKPAIYIMFMMTTP